MSATIELGEPYILAGVPVVELVRKNATTNKVVAVVEHAGDTNWTLQGTLDGPALSLDTWVIEAAEALAMRPHAVLELAVGVKYACDGEPDPPVIRNNLGEVATFEPAEPERPIGGDVSWAIADVDIISETLEAKHAR